MPSIYLTENLYNKQRGIVPWRYIGSDQNDNDDYYGSNRDLKKDINNIGIDNFVKTLLIEYDVIDNKVLRSKESALLTWLGVRIDSTYYNKSDSYSPGCGIKGMKHRNKRTKEHTDKLVESRKGYKLPENLKSKFRELRIGKTYEQIFGDDVAKIARQKQSLKSSGRNNSNSLTWTIISPSGETFTVIDGLKKWCENNNLSFEVIYNSKKGWKTIRHGTGKGGGRPSRKLSDDLNNSK